MSTKALEDQEMTIIIDGEEFEVSKVYDRGYLPCLDCGQEFMSLRIRNQQEESPRILARHGRK